MNARRLSSRRALRRDERASVRILTATAVIEFDAGHQVLLEFLADLGRRDGDLDAEGSDPREIAREVLHRVFEALQRADRHFEKATNTLKALAKALEK